MTNTYNFKAIEKKWKQYWHTKTTIPSTKVMHKATHKKKYYILNMFPYPSGSGLHVGHCLGYVAADVVARYKKSQGYHVLNPMGFDAFGLPAEQYAIQTGQHPTQTTAINIKRYKEQLQQIGLDFNWDREVCTSDPTYYKWTQWIFLQLFSAWYNTTLQKAVPITTLINRFEEGGNINVQAACDKGTPLFTAQGWKSFSQEKQEKILLQYRLAYQKDIMVNWCPTLGTVLANEEVKEGISERGGYPVVRKEMKQWSLRMTAYAERLIQDLEKINWPKSTKEMQRNWIGKSKGATITFEVVLHGKKHAITVFTTRPDTLFGVTYLALSSAHPFATHLAKVSNNHAVRTYITKAQSHTEPQLLTAEKQVTGLFTGSYANHPLTEEPLPIWIADYVIASYGTGAVMGVPAHDSRDYSFANYFSLPIIQVIKGGDTAAESYQANENTLMNSGPFNNLTIPIAAQKIIQKLEEKGHGQGETIYRLHDPTFSRQRYWGEPFPIYYPKETMPCSLSAEELPLELPPVTTYQPTLTGKPPLSNAQNWQTKEGYPLELATMPGWAGSSWYFLRYMDPHNTQAMVSKEAQKYWGAVDFYMGGAEHATGHLLYARFWTKFLYDLGHIDIEEPFQQLVHQGMIQGVSTFVYRIQNSNKFVSYNLRKGYTTTALYVPSSFVQGNVLDIEVLRKWHPDFEKASFILEEGQYICGTKVEKMSKSKHNVVTPDSIIEKYGADTLRIYLLFLGPITQSKPWDMQGIDGVARFLHKTWRLFYHTTRYQLQATGKSPLLQELKVIHRTIKKVTEGIASYSFNTAISSLMICVNELTTLACHNKEILEKVIILLAPFAPYMAAELWEIMGHTTCLSEISFPVFEQKYLQEDQVEYPIAMNGKVRTKMLFEQNSSKDSIEKDVLTNKVIQKWLQGKAPKRIVIVPSRMVNVVV